MLDNFTSSLISPPALNKELMRCYVPILTDLKALLIVVQQLAWSVIKKVVSWQSELVTKM